MLLLGKITTGIEADRSLLRVEQVADRFGLTVRQLQRLFQQYLGVGPKWVIERYRIFEALALLEAQDREAFEGSLAELAYGLGYADQAHFSRVFKRLTGEQPAHYREMVARSGEV
ncbi:helix-turn-helix transcriptional regulator [Polycladidibacter hongkongensis]|uniref:helix-turn-helix transcriptional regulator n=1 Tax=Polycladidibacter hongkongensis TaxID=1647556 RepID=UPI000831ECAA|nr:helix-turn-helix transcriptional regulator [Pseudovibrio hongkongensis]